MVTCPKCGRSTAQGAFCERCGAELSAKPVHPLNERSAEMPDNAPTIRSTRPMRESERIDVSLDAPEDFALYRLSDGKMAGVWQTTDGEASIPTLLKPLAESWSKLILPIEKP